eukprot:13066765-Heterocapsa_arctica.AAC.1
MAHYNCSEQHSPPQAYASNFQTTNRPWIMLTSPDFPKRQETNFGLPKAPLKVIAQLPDELGRRPDQGLRRSRLRSRSWRHGG